MNTETAGDFLNAGDRFFATFAHDVRCTEFFCENNSRLVSAKQNDLGSAKPFGGNDTAQADGAIANHGNCFSGTDAGGDGRMMAGAHHIRER